MKVLGITIGPISETLRLAKTSAMLWYGSAMFSRLTFLLCQELWYTVPNVQILSPAISPDVLATTGHAADGIGKYHDRILCKLPESDVPHIDGIIMRAKSRLAEMICRDKTGRCNPDDMEYLCRYLQVHYVLLSESQVTSNSMTAATPHLDALEQMRHFDPVTNDNILLQLFDKARFRSAQIKQCEMLSKVEHSQLLNPDRTFRSNSQIARIGCRENYGGYYAVIQADGDHMGSYLSTLTDDDQIRAFSQGCLAFAAEASRLIGDFGGMTIYVGGDDLLALAPVHNNHGLTIFDLCGQLRDAFRQIVCKNDDSPSLSIGIAVRYESFPQYEALISASHALFNTAKGRAGKYCVALDWQQQSGHKAIFSIPMEHLDYVNSIVAADGNHGAVYPVVFVLETFQPLLTLQKSVPQQIKTTFVNLYDNESNPRFRPYIEFLAQQFSNLIAQGDRSVQVQRWEGDRDIQTFTDLLHFKHFLYEEGHQEVPAQ